MELEMSGEDPTPRSNSSQKLKSYSKEKREPVIKPALNAAEKDTLRKNALLIQDKERDDHF